MTAEVAAVSFVLAPPRIAALYPSFALLRWSAPQPSPLRDTNDNITSSSSTTNAADTALSSSAQLELPSDTSYSWSYTIEWNCTALLEQELPARQVTRATHIVLPVLYPGATYFVRLLARGKARSPGAASLLTTAKCTFGTGAAAEYLVQLPWLAPHALEGLCLPDALLCAMRGGELAPRDFPSTMPCRSQARESVLVCEPRRFADGFRGCVTRVAYREAPSCALPGRVVYYVAALSYEARRPSSSRNTTTSIITSGSDSHKKRNSSRAAARDEEEEEDVLSLLMEAAVTTKQPKARREGNNSSEEDEEEEEDTSCVVFCGVGERGTLALAWAETCLSSALTVLGRAATQRRVFAITFGPARPTLLRSNNYNNTFSTSRNEALRMLSPAVCQLSGNFLCYTAVPEVLRTHGDEGGSEAAWQLMQYALPTSTAAAHNMTSTSSAPSPSSPKLTTSSSTTSDTMKREAERLEEVYTNVALGTHCGLCWDTGRCAWVMTAWPATMGPVTRAERTECLDAQYHVQLLYQLAQTHTTSHVSHDEAHAEEEEDEVQLEVNEGGKDNNNNNNNQLLSPQLTSMQGRIEAGWLLRVTLSGAQLAYEPQLTCLVREAADFVIPLTLRHVSAGRLMGTASLLPCLVALRANTSVQGADGSEAYASLPPVCSLTLQCMVQTSMGVAFYDASVQAEQDDNRQAAAAAVAAEIMHEAHPTHDITKGSRCDVVTLSGDVAELLRNASLPTTELHHTLASLAGSPGALLTSALLLQPLLVCSQHHRAHELSQLVQSPRCAELRRTTELLIELADMAELLRHKETTQDAASRPWSVMSHVTRLFTASGTSTAEAPVREAGRAEGVKDRAHVSSSTGSTSWTEAYYLEKLLQELSTTEANLPTMRGQLFLWRDRLLRGLPWLQSKSYRRHLRYLLGLFPTAYTSSGGELAEEDAEEEEEEKEGKEAKDEEAGTGKKTHSETEGRVCDESAGDKPGLPLLLVLEMRLYEQVTRYLREECHIAELSHGAREGEEECETRVSLPKCVSFPHFCDCLRPLFLFPTATTLRTLTQTTSPSEAMGSTRAQLASLWTVCLVYELRAELMNTHFTLIAGCPGAGCSTVASVCEGALHTVQVRHAHDPRRFWSRLVLLTLRASELDRVGDVLQLGLPLTLLLVGEASDMERGALSALWRTYIQPFLRPTTDSTYGRRQRQHVHVLLCKADEHVQHCAHWSNCHNSSDDDDECDDVEACATRLCEAVRQDVCAVAAAAHSPRVHDRMPCPALALALAPSLEALTGALRAHTAQTPWSVQALMAALVRQSRRALYVLLRQDLLPGTRAHYQSHGRTLTNATTTSGSV